MSVSGDGRTSLARYFGRFISGRPLDGIRRTNSTFIHWADRDITAHGRASRWAHRPGWHRAAWRLGTVVILGAQVYGYAWHRTALVYADCAAVCALGALGAWAIRRAIIDRVHIRRTVKPIYQIATMITGANSAVSHSPIESHAKYVSIPRDYVTDDNARVRITVPATWEAHASQQKRLSDAVSRRLGGDWDMRARLNEYPPYVEFVKSPAPPNSVSFRDLKSAMDSGDGNSFVIGIGTHNRVIRINLDDDAPHIALSIGTGGGKTSLLRLIIAQLIRHGVQRIDIIDPKRVSHNWARGIPGVFIYRTITQQMECVHNFRLRMESRYDALDTNDALTFPRHVLIIEEQNSWTGLARQYWEDYRMNLPPNERGRVSRVNPAISDLSFCLFQGRQANMNIISVFQRMSARAAGDGDMRENYGAKILARFSPQTWKILIGTSPVPRSSRINGRGIFALGEDHHAVQFGYLREAKAKDWPGLPVTAWTDEARAYALAGLSAAEPAGNEPAGTSGHVDGNGALGEPGALGDGERVTLREAVNAGILRMRLPAARKARERDPEFPAAEPGPIGALYRPRDLTAWQAAREAKRQARRHAATA